MIDTGIDRLKQISDEQAERLRSRSALEFYGRLFTVIKGIPGHTLADHQEFCNRLQELAPAERRQAILQTYGQQCLAKCEPLLVQLDALARPDQARK